MRRISRYLIAVLGAVLPFLNLQAQESVILSGKVIAEDGKPLSNIAVQIARLSVGSYADSTGKFAIIIPKGEHEVSFSYLGYETQTLHLPISRDTFIEVMMKTSVMPEVAISDTRKARTAEHDESGVIMMNKESFSLLPAFLGESDPIRAAQMQPGIQSGNEGSRGIFVRGGSPDQNLMLLDGIPVYNPSHIYGFISVFNGDAIECIDIFKDKYPARFGGRLCSVMDIKADDGNGEKLQGIVSLGLITSRLHLNGPLTKKKQTTFSFSARACYVGLYTSPISKLQLESSGYKGDISYYFGDLNIKVSHRFNGKSKLELNFFTNRDYYSFEKISESTSDWYEIHGTYINDVDWSNEVASITWLNDINEKWEFTTEIGFSRYNLNGAYTDKYGSFQTMSGDTNYYKSIFTETQSFIYNTGWSGEAACMYAKHKVRIGAGANLLVYEMGRGMSSVRSYDYSHSYSHEAPDSNDLVKPGEAFIYTEDEFKAHEKLTIGYGLHGRAYFPKGKTFFSILPRVNAAFNPIAKFYIRFSASGLSQNLHLLTSVNEDILSDYWVPATAKAKPEKGWNFSAGVIQKLPRHFEWSVDGFYRIMNNLIEFKLDDEFSNDESSSLIDIPWEERVVTGGEGKAYGAEFYFSRTSGKITGSAAYTLAWSNRQFDELNRGEYFPYKYDRRHNIAMQVNWLAEKHFEIGVAWVYGSGSAYTLATQSYHSWNAVAWYNELVRNGIYNSGYNEAVNVYSGRNNARLPPFHHLDLSFTYRKQTKNIEHAFNLSVYNIYNRFNVFSIYKEWQTEPDGSVTATYRQLSLFPILPSLTYSLKFSSHEKN